MSSGLHPVRQGRDFGLRQHPAGRHFDSFLVSDHFQDPAFGRRLSGDHRAALAAAGESFGAGEIQPAGLEAGVVAGLALVGQDGTDPFFEELRGLGILGRERGNGSRETEKYGEK